MTNVHSGPSDLTEAILRPAPPPSLTDSSFSRTNGDIIAMQFSAEAGVMPDGGDGGGEAAAAWDGGGYSIGRLATPFTGIDNLAVVKERLETHLDVRRAEWHCVGGVSVGPPSPTTRALNLTRLRVTAAPPAADDHLQVEGEVAARGARVGEATGGEACLFDEPVS